MAILFELLIRPTLWVGSQQNNNGRQFYVPRQAINISGEDAMVSGDGDGGGGCHFVARSQTKGRIWGLDLLAASICRGKCFRS